MGATFLSQFPAYSKTLLGGNASVVTLFMIVFSVGIGIGSYGCTKLLKGVISAKYVPLSAFVLSVFITDLYFVSVNLSPPPDVLITASDFLRSPTNIRILFDLAGISICGGLYTVPLYAILQNDSDPKKKIPHHRGKQPPKCTFYGVWCHRRDRYAGARLYNSRSLFIAGHRELLYCTLYN